MRINFYISCRHSRIHCSLWGEFATDIDKYFDAQDNSKPIVLIIQLGRLRKYMGNFIITAFTLQSYSQVVICLK